MNLEKRVVEGGFYCIRNISHYPAEKRLIVEFIKPPEDGSLTVRVLSFSNIEDFSNELNWEEDEEGEVEREVIDSLIGLGGYPEEEKVQYVVHTEVREIAFYTKDEPLIEDVVKAPRIISGL